MDRKEINLLPQEAILKREKERKQKRSIFGITTILLLGTAIFIAGAFTYSLYLQRQTSSLAEEIKKEERKIERNKKKEELLSATKNKALSLAKILSSRPLHEKRLNSLGLLYELILGEGKIDSFAVQERKIILETSFPNSDLFKIFAETITEKSILDSLFQEVTVGSLNRQEDGSYEVNFEITLL